MLTYAIKRILLMIPTFFAISLLIFVLLNLGAGDPGAQQFSGDGNQNAEKGDNRESYRIFKEQFSLDKPIIFNTRYNLVGTDLEDTITDILNLDGSASLARQIEAQENMDDWGRYAVPGLMFCLTQCTSEEAKAKASQRLAVNAQAPLLTEYTKRDLAPEEELRQKEENKKIRAANRELKAWFYNAVKSEGSTPEALKAQKERITAVEGFWATWWQANESQWSYSAGQKVGIFFFDTRFAKYWGNLLRLDFGKSHIDKKPVLDTVLSKLKYSITLAVSSVFLIYLISLPLGIWSAVRQGSLADKIVTFVLFMLYSLPSFFVAVILLNLLTVGDWAIFPNIGFQSDNAEDMTTLSYIKDVLWHVTLPIVCMSYGGLAALSRYARTGLLDVIRADYIRTARAKGLPEGIVIIKHAARNGMIPIITLMATLLPVLIGGSVIIEVIFGIPGMGSYIFTSITQNDYNAVMVVLLISSLLTLIGMLLADLAYALVDPRITFD
ncbi:MAG: ABC transporter permease [Deltaproteobacteria bacterium]|nr:ABC transporter permease [Deltaproteobacteria bacterium]